MGIIGVAFAGQSVRLAYTVQGYWAALGVRVGAERFYTFFLASLFLLLYLSFVSFRMLRRQKPSNMRLLCETACSYIAYYTVAFCS